MRTSPLLLAIAASVALTLPASIAGQGRPVEFGIDAGGSFDVSGSNTVAIGLPVQDFRAGIFVSDAGPASTVASSLMAIGLSGSFIACSPSIAAAFSALLGRQWGQESTSRALR